MFGVKPLKSIPVVLATNLLISISICNVIVLSSAASGIDVDLSHEIKNTGSASTLNLESETGRAHLLLRQQFLNDYVAEGQNMTIKYTAMNLGALEATDIKISIPTWPNDLFENVDGDVTTTRSRLLPGEIFSHTFTVKPKKPFNLLAVDSRAQIEYRYGNDDPPMEKVGKTSGFKNIEVLTLKKYRKLTVSQLDESKYFIAGSIAMVLIPLLMYYYIRLSFHELKSKIR